jgi:twitching motility protein PilT
MVRVHGILRPLEYQELTPAETKQLAYSVLTDAQKHRFEETLELDFSFGIKGLSRFRANIFNQRGAVGAVFRSIPYDIKSFEELGLPSVVDKLCDKPRGLILVTGPTGSGKSTTLAAMVDKVNRDRHEHIITVEDPIEYLHGHKGCIVNQREVQADTHSFASARCLLGGKTRRRTIGEMRDLRPRNRVENSRDRSPDLRNSSPTRRHPPLTASSISFLQANRPRYELSCRCCWKVLSLKPCCQGSGQGARWR